MFKVSPNFDTHKLLLNRPSDAARNPLPIKSLHLLDSRKEEIRGIVSTAMINLTWTYNAKSSIILKDVGQMKKI